MPVSANRNFPSQVSNDYCGHVMASSDNLETVPMQEEEKPLEKHERP
jgi:hypothetical protein